MNAQNDIFPFGEKLKDVVQVDTTTPKKVFVLGVYASAVHAKWIDANNKMLVRALAVASEPYIFWKGDKTEAQNIISKISIPPKYGKLVPVDSLNGQSGRSLDDNYLEPLNLSRKDAWLCDLVPHSFRNEKQDSALKRVYDKFPDLPGYSIPKVPKPLVTEDRINEILAELKKSQADTIILLGDQPIKYFLTRFPNEYNYKKLSDFEEYGKPIVVNIEGKDYKVIALAHPKQVSKLGQSNKKWAEEHEKWKIKMEKKTGHS